MLVQHFLRDSFERYPKRGCIWYKDKWVTYGELEKRSDSFAWSLKNAGIDQGDRVALLYENSPEYAVAFFAVLKAGAVVVPLNTGNTPEEISYVIGCCKARGLIVQKKYEKLLESVEMPNEYLKVVVSDAPLGSFSETDAECYGFGNLTEKACEKPPCISTIDIDLACIIFTSGSTGKPKGVMLSHLNLVSNTRSIVEYLHLSENDRVQVILPFYYIYGKTLLLTHISSGGSVVIDNRFTYPNLVLDTMERMEVTGFAGVPSTFMILLNRSSLLQKNFPCLRYVTQAGGAMASSVQKEVARTFAPAELVIMYGATELSPRLTYVPPDKLESKWGSIGVAIPNCDAFVADENGNRLPPFTEGEIVGRGSNVMMGYWEDPQGTSKVLRNGLYYTGDRGVMDDEGYLFVVGRSSEMLKIRGRRVSAKEIEDALLALGCVEEVAVIRVEDQILGEAAKAFIVAKRECAVGEEELKRMLSRILPHYKMPSLFCFVESLPKNSSGKIMKKALQIETK
ncbi:MAG: class I adenylate-forming enzyme family protein [Chitinispirillaceae bacterium]